MIKTALAVVALGCAVFSNTDAFERSPLIATKTGQVRGHLITKLSVTEAVDDVYEFSAIPFAEPPVGTNRFRKTVPKKPWGDVLDAINLPNECIQQPASDEKLEFMQPVNMSEDCLYLNIWAPKSAIDNKKSLPVFFWIHGGAYYVGASTSTKFNGTIMSSFQNIIFVSIQYRLGPYGFAYLGVPELPGNMGMWDQVEALKWTYENIAAFGGDPNRITIVGQSAGAGSVTLLLLSPHSRPYIHQAIVQSGAAIASWSHSRKERALAKTNKLLSLLGRKFPSCSKLTPSSTVEEKMACLNSADPSFVARIQILALDIDLDVVTGGVVDSVPLPPVVDGDFLPEDPVEMLVKGDVAKVPMLIGFNRDEGTLGIPTSKAGLALFPTKDQPNRSFENFTYETYHELARGYFVHYPENGQRTDAVILKQIELNYWSRPNGPGSARFSQPPPTGNDVYDKIVRMVGDNMIICPTTSWASAYTNYAKVYQYMFNHQTESKPQYLKWMGVKHSEEIQYTMGDAVNSYHPKVNYTDSEKMLSRKLMQYWAQFVKTGDPNIADSNVPTHWNVPEWPQYTGKTGDTIELSPTSVAGSDSQHLINSAKQRDCLFWARYLPKLNARLKGQLTPGVTPAPCPQYRSAASSATSSFSLVAIILLATIFLI